MHQLEVADPFGHPQTVISAFTRLEYSRAVNKVGYLYLDFNPASVDTSIFRLDTRIKPMRSVGALPPYLDGETVFFLKDWGYDTARDGSKIYHLECVDAMSVLDGPIVAYPAQDAKAIATAVAADDLMKRIVRENLGADATDTTRSLAAYLDVQANLTAAPVVTKEFAHLNVLKLLQALASESAQKGTYLAFDVVYTSPTKLEFRTYTGQRGINHGRTGAQPVIVSRDRRNLEIPSAWERHKEERTFVYAGGQGQEGERVVKTATNAAAMGLSPFGRRELWVDARQAETDDAVQSEANTGLQENGAKRSLTGTVIDTDGCIYGVHFRYGDIVYMEYEGAGADAHVDTINIVVESGRETKTCKIAAEV